MPSVTRDFPFCAGHRLMNHPGKCRFLHGHNYVARVTVYGTPNDYHSTGIVMDFGVMKEIIGGWIDKNWDHNMILHEDDPLIQMKRIADEISGMNIPIREPLVNLFGDREPYIMPRGMHPTAESLAEVLRWVLNPTGSGEHLLRQFVGLDVGRIRIQETPNCWASI